MKASKLLFITGTLFLAVLAHAQVSVNVNIGSQPKWAPNNQQATEYYYLPDVETYYDVRQSQFIYYGNGRWLRSRNLPNQYRNYDLYSGYKVVLNNYHGSRPYSNFKSHKVKYYKGYKGNKHHYNKRKVYSNNNHFDNHDDHRDHDRKKNKEKHHYVKDKHNHD
ncbi:hypothetical protein SAMN05444396_105301 [Flavobacterium segetis]|uniref:YXWGXW repeat-containing protein n=1 Tax=Flavobacterium segetis TaxID=271157 RepID=A0A1M5HT74_9FLAO|nr:hypothetical protein [Flavobacterium segetis]SHG19123.1 hypothetical protein SAMN05444396_105301 [Flavobacterium segetis]